MINRTHSLNRQYAFIGITLFILLLHFKPMQAGGVARITVTLDIGRTLDTLYLMKFNGGCAETLYITPTLKAVAEGHKLYRFEIPVVNPDESFGLCRRIDDDTTEQVFKLQIGGSYKYLSVTPQFYLSSDDDVNIHIKKARANLQGLYFLDYAYTFSGKDSARYEMVLRADSMLNRNAAPWDFDRYRDYLKKGSPKKELLAMLEDVRPQISDFHYRLIKTDIQFSDAQIMFKALRAHHKANISNWSPESSRLAFEKMISDYFPEDASTGNPYSRRYIAFLVEKASFESELAHGDPEPSDVFNRMAIPLNSSLRDRALVYYLFNYKIENAEALYDKAFTIVEDRSCIAELESAGARFRGTQKVEFTLPDTSGNLRSISDLSGKWVLIDFWFSGCSGCKRYYSEVIKRLEKEFEDDPGFSFVSVSADRGKTKWLESVSKGIYSSPHAINLFTNGEGLEHEVLRKYGIALYPTVILVDPDGYIAAFNTPDLAVQDGEKVTRYIRSLMEQRGK